MGTRPYNPNNFSPAPDARHASLPRDFERGRRWPNRRGVVPIPDDSPRQAYVKRLRERHLQKLRENESPFAEYDLGNKELPIYPFKRDIITMINENKVSQLSGQTGSGKTTQLAQFALEAGYDRMVYLMPRRPMVDNVEARMKYELKRQLGEKYPADLVGRVHSEANSTTDKSKIQIMTAGSFSRMIGRLSEQWRDEKVLVVADEIHEANLEMEFATALAAWTIDERDSWRMVLSTATPNPRSAEAYQRLNESGVVPVVDIPTRPHDLEMIERPDQTVDEAYEMYGKSARKTLLFVEGKREIKNTINALRRRREPGDNVRYLKFHANVSDAARREIFESEPSEGERWVIVSTSAGQSGITISGVDLAISNGITKSPELDEESKPGLPKRLCTQAELLQQAGRAGRDVAGGRFVLARPVETRRASHRSDPLFEFHSLESREEHIPPEIYNTNVSSNILQAMVTFSTDFSELNGYLINRVKPWTIDESYAVLEMLGAITINDDGQARVTRLGEHMSAFPLRPELARSAVEALGGNYSLKVKTAFLAIAASIEAGGLAAHDADGDSNLWLELLDDYTNDDFLAEYDMFHKSSGLYWRDYQGIHHVKERKARELGLEPKRVQTANKQFRKLCWQFGLNAHDIVLDTLTFDERESVKDILLVGMPDLIYDYSGVSNRGGSRRVFYRNPENGQAAIDRELSDRSVTLRCMGGQAYRQVAGYGWWYLDKSGVRSVIDRSLPVDPARLKRVMTKAALEQYAGSAIVNGELVEVYERRWGRFSDPRRRYKKLAATTEAEIMKLTKAYEGQGREVYQALQAAAIPKDKISDIVRKAATGSHSVGEVEAKMWAEIQEQLSEQELARVYG